jgi:polyisoprenoid-binding protein YceI
MRIVSVTSKAKSTKREEELAVEGELTIHGVTGKVVLAAEGPSEPGEILGQCARWIVCHRAHHP